MSNLVGFYLNKGFHLCFCTLPLFFSKDLFYFTVSLEGEYGGKEEEEEDDERGTSTIYHVSCS